MADARFEDPRLVSLADPLDPERPDLEAYLALVDEVCAASVLDVGCGTGTFACLLAQRGTTVFGVDPAAASLAVARAKPGADRVRWIRGDATTLPALQVDLATMTGNVAQVFLTDEEWAATLAGVASALRPGGVLAFEVRDPSRRGWREWNRQQSRRRLHVPGVGAVESWDELTDVRLPFVSFRSTFVFESDGTVVTSASTLRFRSRAEIEAALRAAGFSVGAVRDAPDRPGREFVFVATKATTPD